VEGGDEDKEKGGWKGNEEFLCNCNFSSGKPCDG